MTPIRRLATVALVALSFIAIGAQAQTWPSQSIKLIWKALVAPKGTPPAVVETLNEAVNTALSKPSTIALLLADGSMPMGGTPEQAARMIASEHALWGGVIRQAGIKPE